jgi:two-component system sensor histidine kinase CpxA
VLVSWINQSLILHHEVEQPGRGFEVNLNRVKSKLSRELAEGGEQQVTQALRGLPRGMRNHIFVLDADDRELLGRDRLLRKLKRGRIKVASKQMTGADGREYTLISAGRIPPRTLFAPGPRGVGMRLLVAAVISALVSLVLARYLAAPLGQLSRASRRLATGDLSARVGEPLDKNRDEFGQLARDMDEMAARLQVAQEANRRLLRDVSHELRSPLARLRVALEIARSKDQSQVVEELNRIELESERLEVLVDEVLALLRESSDSQQLNITGFDLVELLQDLIETVNYEITDSGNLIKLEVQGPQLLEADRDMLWRVFENLLRNALLHGGGTVVVNVNAVPSGNEIDIRVTDSGPGIAEQHLARIFEPFYRVDEARARTDAGHSTGHGLGLAIAASAVRRHGGRISANNRPGGGLEVSVVLPVQRSRA